MTRLARHFIVVGGLAAAVVIAASVIAPRAAHGDTPQTSHLTAGQCFRSADVRNWVAPDAKTLYLRVLVNRYYRVDLARECSPLRRHDPMLITGTVGSDWVCAPLDWSLRASDWPGDIPETCFISRITKLSPDEAAALPKNSKP